MIIERLEEDFSICKVSDFSKTDLNAEFCFIGKTDKERSLVCLSDSVPENAFTCDANWKGFRIKGTLDFSLIGILSKISSALAEGGVGIFAVSTYDTDYVFVKRENFEKVPSLLSKCGFEVF